MLIPCNEMKRTLFNTFKFKIRLRTPYTNIFVGALGLRYVQIQIHSAASCYHYCGHVHAHFMKAVIYLSKYVVSNCLSFLLVGNGDTIMSRLSVVTWIRFCSISTPFYCLFGADGDVLRLGEELSPHDSAAGFDQPSASIGGGILAKHKSTQ